jgi:glyoxylase I family protein
VKPQAVHHVSVTVTNLDEALDFYTRVLGMQMRRDRPASLGAGAWLNAGPQQIHLIQGTPPPPCGQHFALLVEDLDAVTIELRAKRVDVSDAVPIGTARQAFLTDPSGNAIELHEPAQGQ